jgi:hypothetical protein
VLNFAAGAFALDFTNCPGSYCTAILDSGTVTSQDPFKNDPNKKIENKELTIEAWVKNKATSTLTGGIFGRLDSGGIALYAKNNKIKAVVRRRLVPTGTVEYTVESISNISSAWTHVAAVLVNEDHTSTPSHIGVSAGCTTAKGETPHLDLYINGTFVNCASTSSQFSTEPASSIIRVGILGWNVDGVSSTAQFEGLIDEVRLWGVARTQSEIQQCMNRELSITGGSCSISSSLISYFRFNEGSGSIIAEFTGLGAGGLEYPNPTPNSYQPSLEWTTGWTTETPF